MKKKNVLKLILIFIIGAVFITVMSKNSFLFRFNDWWDANAFMTVGKSIWNGVVPYRDLFEQKGPYLYFIYALAALISNKTFIGVYFLELLAMFINLIFVRKIIKLFYKDEKYSFLGILLYCFLAFFNFTFGHGGSAEEFTLPLMFISMYYYIKYLKDKKTDSIDKKILLFNGIIAGIVFWIKYSLLGFWFIFAATMCLIPLFKKDIKQALMNALIFIVGMLIATIPCLIYFGINNAIDDLFKIYLLVNMTSYATKMSLLSKIWKMIYILLGNIFGNISYLLFILVPIIILHKKDIFKGKKYAKVWFTLSFLFTGMLAFIGGTSYFYYGYILTPFTILGIIYIIDILNKRKIKLKIYHLSLLGVIFLTILILTSDNTKYMKWEKSDYAQMIFADIIEKSEEKTLLNYYGLDFGLYTTTGITPKYYYFMRNNIPNENYPRMRKNQRKYIKSDERPKYVIAKKEYNLLKEYYDIIAVKKQRYEKRYITYYLYERKNNQ